MTITNNDNHISSKKHKELEAAKVKKEGSLITKGLTMESEETGSQNAKSEIAESSLHDKVDDDPALDDQLDDDDDDDDDQEVNTTQPF